MFKTRIRGVFKFLNKQVQQNNRRCRLRRHFGFVVDVQKKRVSIEFRFKLSASSSLLPRRSTASSSLRRRRRRQFGFNTKVFVSSRRDYVQQLLNNSIFQTSFTLPYTESTPRHRFLSKSNLNFNRFTPLTHVATTMRYYVMQTIQYDLMP